METVTAGLVGMEINVNSSVISPPGRASEDARLQMAKSAVTEVCHSFTLLQMGGGGALNCQHSFSLDFLQYGRKLSLTVFDFAVSPHLLYQQSSLSYFMLSKKAEELESCYRSLSFTEPIVNVGAIISLAAVQK